ncbi:PRKCA-binding protein [Clonorchis sinensis]|uniref:PRKCA-binding protein n=2 Tax=Clonorchis sinensis TaxID=79923 RepID=A0A8T1M6K3_CLOSI|nr:PRKCA-binding protein [Clonorchis sinensis]
MYTYDYGYEEDKLGMTVTSGCVTLTKDAQNLVGISIGGGAPYCPCLYVVQVFDSTPASEDATLQAGDEITAVNGIALKGKSKVEAARLIQSFKDKVVINFNKLHADPKQGKTLDIVLKKAKHRVVEFMESSTADALGLSRAILVNDGLVKKFDELNKTATMFSGMMAHAKNLLRAIYELSRIYAGLADVFSEIGVKEPMLRTSEAFTQFGTTHRSMERFSIEMLKKIKPIIADLSTFLRKVIPDTRLTIKKYLDVKFEYLSYCLKVKEMDDEEYSFALVHEPLYRVETGNYEYRLILRCRQDARTRFAKMRSDVLVKLELLDNKHVQDTVKQLQRFIDAMAAYHDQCYGVMKQAKIFPLEVDLDRTAFTYDTGIINTGEDELEVGEETNERGEHVQTMDDLTDDFQLIDLSAPTGAPSQDTHGDVLLLDDNGDLQGQLCPGVQDLVGLN